MTPYKNITRFTYQESSFEGWRLALCRCRLPFTHYFPDKKYGGKEQALTAAQEMRRQILDLVDVKHADPANVFARYDKKGEEGVYPAGLRPSRTIRQTPVSE